MRRLLRFSFLAVLLFLSPRINAAEGETVVFDLSGNGTRNTRPFTVQNKWEIRWDVKTDHFALHLYTATGEAQGMLPVGSQDGPGRGATFGPDGGNYYLKIIAKGDWHITVVQLP